MSSSRGGGGVTARDRRDCHRSRRLEGGEAWQRVTSETAIDRDDPPCRRWRRRRRLEGGEAWQRMTTETTIDVREPAVSLVVVANWMLFAIRLHWRTCCMLLLDHYSCTPLSPSLVSLHYKIQTTDYYQTSNSCFTQQSGKYFK